MVEQPLKIPFVAAVLVVINPQKSEVVAEILQKASGAVRGFLDLGSWREVKLVLRFLACLQGVLEGDGLFPVLDELFSRAVDLQTASSEDVSGSNEMPWIKANFLALHRAWDWSLSK